eukprot:CAMPEP_0204269596 /NCGR_PEP_ID=MMETSP0468-20130131/16563_1 /ASSEMBLY_ACC=CAM_ASM_000383 /TAXON_ID=2969 /ORGANISM="Oxyrrhis marina" /LENGTH=584 /DNA_ID=CAMNT_0051244997 /DNA_START=56 /DNA_END=1810 /DNA_ORIENTATION=+
MCELIAKTNRSDARLRKLQFARERREQQIQVMPRRFTAVPHGARRCGTRRMLQRGLLESGEDVLTTTISKSVSRERRARKPAVCRLLRGSQVHQPSEWDDECAPVVHEAVDAKDACVPQPAGLRKVECAVFCPTPCCDWELDENDVWSVTKSARAVKRQKDCEVRRARRTARKLTLPGRFTTVQWGEARTAARGLLARNNVEDAADMPRFSVSKGKRAKFLKPHVVKRLPSSAAADGCGGGSSSSNNNNSNNNNNNSSNTHPNPSPVAAFCAARSFPTLALWIDNGIVFDRSKREVIDDAVACHPNSDSIRSVLTPSWPETGSDPEQESALVAEIAHARPEHLQLDGRCVLAQASRRHEESRRVEIAKAVAAAQLRLAAVEADALRRQAQERLSAAEEAATALKVQAQRDADDLMQRKREETDKQLAREEKQRENALLKQAKEIAARQSREVRRARARQAAERAMARKAAEEVVAAREEAARLRSDALLEAQEIRRQASLAVKQLHADAERSAAREELAASGLLGSSSVKPSVVSGSQVSSETPETVCSELGASPDEILDWEMLPDPAVPLTEGGCQEWEVLRL